MPIHDQGYRRYTGARSVLGRRWLVIARAGIKTLFTYKAFIGLLLLSWFPFLIRSVQIYVSTSVPQARELVGITPATFRDFLDQQSIWVFFITIYVGSGLIANDRRANALQIYLSKPLSRLEYIVGKLAILLTFLLLVTGVPGLLLLLLQVLFTGDFTFVRQNLHLLPAITLYSIIQAVVFSATMLALSSLSKSSRYVAILYAGVIFLSQAVYGVLREVTGDTTVAWVSMPANMRQIGAAIFRVPLEYRSPWPVSALVIAAVVGVSALVLDRRVRGVEIVT
ncbi:MAG TPA: ABC transporter permease subunit [Vicinamibacterales bacterium]|nr:ABC transporter permease subunit [Vicinamibacterales bacterium]